MKRRTHQGTILICGLACVLLWPLSAGSARGAEPVPTAIVPASASGEASLIAAVRHATDPSQAIQAYAAARAREPQNFAVERAYVQRMVAFGLPEMAAAQAFDLSQRDPGVGVPWAVLAYVEAQHGNSPQAVLDMSAAAKRAPEDPFVLRTAGQIMAWFDLYVDKATVTPEVRIAADYVREKLGTRPPYLSAYQEALQLYETGSSGAVLPQEYAQAALPSAGTYSASAAADYDPHFNPYYNYNYNFNYNSGEWSSPYGWPSWYGDDDGGWSPDDGGDVWAAPSFREDDDGERVFDRNQEDFEPWRDDGFHGSFAQDHVAGTRGGFPAGRPTFRALPSPGASTWRELPGQPDSRMMPEPRPIWRAERGLDDPAATFRPHNFTPHSPLGPFITHDRDAGGFHPAEVPHGPRYNAGFAPHFGAGDIPHQAPSFGGFHGAGGFQGDRDFHGGGGFHGDGDFHGGGFHGGDRR